MNPTSSRWLDKIKLLDDEPIDGRMPDDDLLEMKGLVELCARSIRRADGPLVIHVDGAWGRGKTSYCRALAAELTQNPESSEQRVSVSWHTASDVDGPPGDAILYALANAITDRDPEESDRILRTWGSEGEPRVSSLVRKENFRSWAERELGWEEAVDGGTAREVTIKRADGGEWNLSAPGTRKRTALVIVDDLDRCSPDRVVEVLDAVRVFVSCRGVSFVLAADRDVIEGAFRHTVESLGASGNRRATDALEKYIRHRIELPGIDALQQTNATDRIIRLQKRMFTDGVHDLLKGPPGLLGDGVGVAIAKSFPHSLTIRTLKLVLNRLAVDIALAADRCRLSVDALSQTLTDGLWSPDRLQRLRFDYPDRLPEEPKLDDYAEFFVGRLVRVTAEYLWPDLLEGTKSMDQRLRDRVAALAAIGSGLRNWPTRVLHKVLDQIVAPCSDVAPIGYHTKLEMAKFLSELHATFKRKLGGQRGERQRSDVDLHKAPTLTGRDVEQTPSPTPASAAPSALVAEFDKYRARLVQHRRQQPENPEEWETLRQYASTLLRDVDDYISKRGMGGEDSEKLIRRLESTAKEETRLVTDFPTEFVSIAKQARASGRPDLALALLELLRDHGLFEAGEEGLARLVYYLHLFVDPELVLADDSIDRLYDWTATRLGSATSPPEAAVAAVLRQFKPLSLKLHPDVEERFVLVRMLHHLEQKGQIVDHQFLESEDLRYLNRVAEQRTGKALLDWVRLALAGGSFTLNLWQSVPHANVPVAENDTLQAFRLAADALGSQTDPASRTEAIRLYEELEHSLLFTVSVAHNLASLIASLDTPDGSYVDVRGNIRVALHRAGRLWEAAYRRGFRDQRMQRAFAEVLENLSENRLARLVLGSEELPEPLKCFGSEPDAQIAFQEREQGGQDAHGGRS